MRLHVDLTGGRSMAIEVAAEVLLQGREALRAGVSPERVGLVVLGLVMAPAAVAPLLVGRTIASVSGSVMDAILVAQPTMEPVGLLGLAEAVAVSLGTPTHPRAAVAPPEPAAVQAERLTPEQRRERTEAALRGG